MWANMSQYSGIRVLAEGVGYQFQRCLISLISSGHHQSFQSVQFSNRAVRKINMRVQAPPVSKMFNKYDQLDISTITDSELHWLTIIISYAVKKIKIDMSTEIWRSQHI